MLNMPLQYQMMCLYDGIKEWQFFDTATQIDHIPMWSGYYDKKTKNAGACGLAQIKLVSCIGSFI
jgi:hypothetical protein